MYRLYNLLAQVDTSPLPKVGTNNNDAVQTILNIVFSIAGAVAVLMISLGAFRFVTSRGNPETTAKARNTVIYSTIGLIIVLISFAIVNFVVGRL